MVAPIRVIAPNAANVKEVRFFISAPAAWEVWHLGIEEQPKELGRMLPPVCSSAAALIT
jgi:hypothetical protein